jgi:hypothetical protein
MIVSADRTSPHRPGCPGGIRLGVRDSINDSPQLIPELMVLISCAQNNTNGGRSHLFVRMDFAMPRFGSPGYHCATRQQC